MKRNGIIILGVVLIVIVIAIIFGWRAASANAAATNNRAQTATVQRGTLVATVNAAGNVSAAQTASLTFQTTGRIAQVNVQVGDAVKKGQVLMTLDTTDLELALKSAQANLASAQANFDSAKAKTGSNNDQVLAAKATLDKTAAAVKQAQAAYDKIGGASNPNIGMTSQALTLQQASDDYQAALANYNITVAGINDTTLRTAQAQLDSAQVAVDQAKNNLAKAQLVAPFDGAVSAVNLNVGDTASTSAGNTGTNPPVALINLSNLQVQVNVAEVDLPKIKVGETAQITFDALPGKTYTGSVKKISPAGVVTQGVVNYPVTLAITNADSSIDPGMTTNLNIVVDQRTNVLIAPLRAVRTQGNQKVVTAVYKNQTIQVPVTTGLSNDQSVEITSGLQEGDVVVVSQTTTTQNAAPRGFGPGAGPFIRGD